MEALLKSLSPETIAVVGAAIILREVFRFLRSYKDGKTSSSLISATEVELKRFGDIMNQVGTNLDANTKATQGLTDSVKELFYEMKVFSTKLESLVKDVDELKQHRCPPH